ncbi:MAG: hypothetical protein PSX81_01710 [bacterium]|nr:hypothetical protein [bacterium]MDI1232977.1 hypothetical protein [bacterium]
MRHFVGCNWLFRNPKTTFNPFRVGAPRYFILIGCTDVIQIEALQASFNVLIFEIILAIKLIIVS